MGGFSGNVIMYVTGKKMWGRGRYIFYVQMWDPHTSLCFNEGKNRLFTIDLCCSYVLLANVRLFLFIVQIETIYCSSIFNIQLFSDISLLQANKFRKWKNNWSNSTLYLNKINHDMFSWTSLILISKQVPYIW